MEESVIEYVTNDLGDIYGRRRHHDRTVEPFDPDVFGWSRPKNLPTSDNRRSIDQIETLPGFSLTVEPGDQLVPGPRPLRRPPRLQWRDGVAPPAAAESRGGIGGTHPTHDRLTDALGHVAERLPGRPDRSPFIVHDLVGGRRITVEYQAPPFEPGGAGTVYVLDDGHAFKIGHTNGDVAKRVDGLQTGNPNVIQTVAEVRSASLGDEKQLQAKFDQWALRGEWFKRVPLQELAAKAGGWEGLLRSRLPARLGGWEIVVYPRYTLSFGRSHEGFDRTLD